MNICDRGHVQDQVKVKSASGRVYQGPGLRTMQCFAIDTQFVSQFLYTELVPTSNAW